MSSNKNLVVTGFTLALLIASYGELPGVMASYGGRGLCDESTGIRCTSDAMCKSICKPRTKANYIDAYWSKDRGTVGCVCLQLCDGPLTPSPEDEPSSAADAGDDDIHDAGMVRDGNAYN
ncbi:hypothetical protein BAE44_0010341 [Dichanthelium oligosanthes]|uniref:Knottin scorpion toxin-like domain-containing protein n=1 Tax=Dichanthelium oligosanthes TaxID=888268 RepID=A0A1E5VU56_9POAL|nr:hypothetical protein BAE44_0010341 [Dichanthelium oligosanthes]